MKKAVVLSLLLIFFSVIVIVNSPLASALSEVNDIPLTQSNDLANTDPLKSSAPIPSPHTLLLIGSGLIGLIIYRKRFKDKR